MTRLASEISRCHHGRWLRFELMLSAHRVLPKHKREFNEVIINQIYRAHANSDQEEEVQIRMAIHREPEKAANAPKKAKCGELQKSHQPGSNSIRKRIVPL